MKSTCKNSTATEKDLHISAHGLKGKQSVRATFRLPDNTIKLLGIVAAQLGLKQKSLFDQLIEDIDTLSKVAETAPAAVSCDEERRQKTFVLSKRSVEVLDNVAKRQNIPRDVLVETSIRRLLPIMDEEQKKHKKRVRIYQEMETYRDQCRKLQRKATRLLGKEDHAAILMDKIAGVCEESAKELGVTIENGQKMENYG
jgi:hypothetical protein